MEGRNRARQKAGSRRADSPPEYAPQRRSSAKIPRSLVLPLERGLDRQGRGKSCGAPSRESSSLSVHEPEKAEITIAEADDLYREVRVENVVTDENGEKARLKSRAQVDVIVETDSSATIKKPENT